MFMVWERPVVVRISPLVWLDTSGAPDTSSSKQSSTVTYKWLFYMTVPRRTNQLAKELRVETCTKEGKSNEGQNTTKFIS